MKAVHEFGAPKSCGDCDLSYVDKSQSSTGVIRCVIGRRTSREIPLNCPLKIRDSKQSCVLCKCESEMQITFNRKIVCHECWEKLVALHIEHFGDAPVLEPCPFCGGEARAICDHRPVVSYRVVCESPSAACFLHAVNVSSGNRAAIVAAWNRRAPA